MRLMVVKMLGGEADDDEGDGGEGDGSEFDGSEGDDGKGDGVKARLNPSLCPFDLTKESNSDNFVYCVLLNGKQNMPGYSKKLDDSKIKVLVIYIKKFKK